MIGDRFKEPGDLKINQFRLYNRDKTVSLSLMGQLVTASVYEDLQAPVLYAEIELRDGINIVQRFPIVGEELVELEFVSPGLPVPASYFFAVFSVKNISADSNAQMASYVLRCVSVEQLRSASRMSQIAVASGTYSDVVKDLLVRELQTTKKAYIEPTRGVMGNVVPKLKPLAAIDYLRKMAISTSSATSAFVFFENQLGFHFRTVENLIEESRKKPIKEFIYVANVMSSKEGAANSQRNIIKYEIISRTDTVDQIQKGVLNNVVSGYDLISKEVRSTPHDLSQAIGSFVTTDQKARSTVSRSTQLEYGQQPNDTFFIPYDSSKGEIYRDLSFAARRAYTTLLNQTVVRVMLHGDTTMVAGDLIDIKFPDVSSTTDTQKPDAFTAGKYLIVRLRHILVNDLRQKHIITADLIKIGYAA